MEYLQITVSTTSEGSDLVSMALYELGSDGVSISDDSDVLELITKKLNWDYVDEGLIKSLNGKALVSGYFSLNFETKKVYEALERLKKQSEIQLGSLEVSVERISSSDWENEWRKYYSPIPLGKIVIVPAWLKAPEGDALPVYIEPGMAFGTGNHETTSLCIELMQCVQIEGVTVLDMGCGSGILGIAAARLGAKKVVLSDIDRQAVEASCQNVALNGVEDCCEIVGGDLNCGNVSADVVIANITADVLLRLKDTLGSALKKDGFMIISGIIHSRLEEVKKGYADEFEVVKGLKKGEWNAMLLKRRCKI